MRIEGYVARNGLILIPSLLVVQELGIAESVVFELDTGADRTVISDGDALRMGIDCSQLDSGVPALGVGGVAPTRILKNALLIFISDGWLIVKGMKKLEVLVHETDDPNLQQVLLAIPSLLGRDVLGKKFKLESDGKNVVLEI